MKNGGYMRYYKVLYDYEHDDNYIFCSTGVIGDRNRYITSKGKLIENWKEVTFVYNSQEGDILTDYMANIYGWFIVSDKFRSETERLLSDVVQYLPVKILDSSNKTENHLYQIANILDVIDAIDFENSKYDIFEVRDQKVLSVIKYALKKSKIQGHHIFRLRDDTIPIFVSEEIKTIVETNNLLGFSFWEVFVN